MSTSQQVRLHYLAIFKNPINFLLIVSQALTFRVSVPARRGSTPIRNSATIIEGILCALDALWKIGVNFSPAHQAVRIYRLLYYLCVLWELCGKNKNDKTKPILKSLTHYKERTNPKIAQKKQTQLSQIVENFRVAHLPRAARRCGFVAGSFQSSIENRESSMTGTNPIVENF